MTNKINNREESSFYELFSNTEDDSISNVIVSIAVIDTENQSLENLINNGLKPEERIVLKAGEPIPEKYKSCKLTITYNNGVKIVKDFAQLNNDELAFMTRQHHVFNSDIDSNADWYLRLYHIKKSIINFFKKLFHINGNRRDQFTWLDYYKGIYNTQHHDFDKLKELLSSEGSPYIRNPYPNYSVESKYYQEYLINIDILYFLSYYIGHRKVIDKLTSLLKCSEFDIENDDFYKKFTDLLNERLGDGEIIKNESAHNFKFLSVFDMKDDNNISLNIENAKEMEEVIDDLINLQSKYKVAKNVLGYYLISDTLPDEDFIRSINPDNMKLMIIGVLSDLSLTEITKINEKGLSLLSANTENLINHLNQYGLGMDPRVVDDIIAKKIKYKELDGRLPFYVVDHLIISQME